MGNLPNEDGVWLDDVLKVLPTVPVTAALQGNILASFDAVMARRDAGLSARCASLQQPFGRVRLRGGRQPLSHSLWWSV